MKPILGILTEWQGDERADRPFGAQTALFEAILRVAEDSPIRACVIPQQELELEPLTANAELRAYVLSEGKWEEVASPFPDVIYNRLPNRRAEQAKEKKAFIRTITDHAKGRVFNRTGFFTKYHIYSLFAKKAPAGLRIPFTKKVTTAKQVLQAADRWGQVWLKPDDGSLGRGVCRLIKEPYGFTLEIGDQGSAEHVDESRIQSKIASILQTGNAYIVQRNIDAARYEGRPFDIRVLLHKDHVNQFGVTHAFARVMEHGHLVSNLTAGGDGLPLRKVLTVKEITRLKAVALAAAKRLDAALKGPVGELGLDLAFDQKRRLWLVEANSKPYLKMDPSDPVTQKIAACIVSYAAYLIQQDPPQSKPAKPAPAPSRNKTKPKVRAVPAAQTTTPQSTPQSSAQSPAQSTTPSTAQPTPQQSPRPFRRGSTTR